QDRGALRACHLLELLLPARRLRPRHLLLADDMVEEQVEQAVLAADVPVQRRRASVEFVGYTAHGQAVQPFAVQDPQRGLDDRLLGDRVAAAAGGTRGRALPGDRRQRFLLCRSLRLRDHFIGHLTNSVLQTNSVYIVRRSVIEQRSSYE